MYISKTKVLLPVFANLSALFSYVCSYLTYVSELIKLSKSRRRGCLKPLIHLSLKQKKAIISDCFLVDNSIEISNISFTPRNLIDTHNLISLIVKNQGV